jgi:hypothetical protein
VDSVIVNFQVTSGGDYAILEWTSGVEAGLVKYKIERSIDNVSFSFVADVFPQGDNHTYTYTDDDVMKYTTQRLYYYRIKMLFTGNTFAYTPSESVLLAFSGFQETWGSIKAMFR